MNETTVQHFANANQISCQHAQVVWLALILKNHEQKTMENNALNTQPATGMNMYYPDWNVL